MRLYIIGAGGTASYLLPVLVRTITRKHDIEEVIIVDRDVIEEKNVERQNYTYDEVGQGKAEAIAGTLRKHCTSPIVSVDDWFTEGFPLFPDSFIISCTDNHPARLALLNCCDDHNCRTVICGNETYSADAYYYQPSFRDTLKDPRIRYPEIVTNKQDDPTRPPCNGVEALNDNPQLAAANFMSANLGMHLTQLWLFEIESYDLAEAGKYLPIELSSVKTDIKVLKQRDFERKTP